MKLRTFENLFGLDGTKNRLQYLFLKIIYSLILGLTGSQVAIIVEYVHPLIIIIFYLIMVWMGICLTVQRLNDLGKSGYWSLLILIPLVGFFLFLYLVITKGSDSPQENKKVVEKRVSPIKSSQISAFVEQNIKTDDQRIKKSRTDIIPENSNPNINSETSSVSNKRRYPLFVSILSTVMTLIILGGIVIYMNLSSKTLIMNLFQNQNIENTEELDLQSILRTEDSLSNTPTVLLPLIPTPVARPSEQKVTNLILNNVSISALALTIGYIDRQNEIIRSSNIPEGFLQEIKREKSIFDIQFGEPLQKVKQSLEEYLGKEVYENSLYEFRKNFNNIKMNELNAHNFLDILTSQNNGFFESEPLVGKVLLHYKFEENPHLEFVNGYRDTFLHEGNSKSKGISFSVEHPRSWVVLESKFPNTVMKVIGGFGFGPYGCTFVVNDDYTKNLHHLTKSEKIEFLKNSKEMAPPGSKILSFKITNLTDNSPMSVTDYEFSMPGLDIKKYNSFMVTRSFNLLSKNNKIISVGCFVTAKPTHENTARIIFSNVEPTFNLIINSLTSSHL